MTTDANRVAEVDVAIVGGGPAGLSAALVLGRALKKVLLLDAGPRRNAKAEHINGFVTRDGTPPNEFRRIAREQLAPYDVTLREERVASIAPRPDGFLVSLEAGDAVLAARVVLAMGVADEPADIPGMREVWGHTAFQCPHCHGWERRGKTWGVLVLSEQYAEFPVMLTGWTPNVVAFTHGTFEVPAEARQRLSARGVRLVTQPVKRILSEAGGVVRGLELEDGSVEAVDALFHAPKQHLSPLIHSLGLAITDAGYVRVNERQETSVAGLYAAGDLTTPGQAAIIAVGSGANAGFNIVHSLNFHGRHRGA